MIPKPLLLLALLAFIASVSARQDAAATTQSDVAAAAAAAHTAHRTRHRAPLVATAGGTSVSDALLITMSWIVVLDPDVLAWHI